MHWCLSQGVCDQQGKEREEEVEKRYYYLYAHFRVVFFSWHHLPRSPSAICSQRTCSGKNPWSEYGVSSVFPPRPTLKHSLTINYAKKKSPPKHFARISILRGPLSPTPVLPKTHTELRFYGLEPQALSSAGETGDRALILPASEQPGLIQQSS